MKKIITLTIFLFSLSVSLYPFFTERDQDLYYYYLFLTGHIENLNDYPVFKNDYEKNYFNGYSKYLFDLSSIEEKSFFKDIKFILNSELYYKNRFDYNIFLKGKFGKKIGENFYISTSAFLLTDTSNPYGYNVKPFKDKILAGFDNGYFMFKNQNILLLFGRTSFNSGFEYDRSLIYSYNAPPSDGFLMNLKFNDNFTLTSKFLNLGDFLFDSTYDFENEQITKITRFLSFHKLTFSYNDFLLSFSESVIFGRNSISGIFDYAFPLFVFYGEQNNIGKNDNILWQFDLNYRLFKKLNFLWSLLVDDYQYEYEGVKDLEPPELGNIFAISYPFDKGFLKISYIRVNAWVYNQKFPWNRYQNNGKVIGYEEGGDVQKIKLDIDYLVMKSLDLKVNTSYSIKGDNYIYSIWPFPTTNIYWYETQIGIEPVKRNFDLSLKLEYIFKNSILYIQTLYEYTIEEEDRMITSFGLKIIL